jgi:hypothetical protein
MLKLDAAAGHDPRLTFDAALRQVVPLRTYTKCRRIVSLEQV